MIDERCLPSAGARETFRVALIGIDGAGKSTLVNSMLSAGALAESDRLMRFPAFHLDRDLPCQELSRDLTALAQIAEELQSGLLKLTALYLYATLFGPIEKFLVGAMQPRLLLQERHVIVDLPSYLPVYARLGKPCPPDLVSEACLCLAHRRPQGASHVRHWAQLLSERTDTPPHLEAIPAYLEALAAHPLTERVRASEEACGTKAPDLLFLLDVPADIAQERIASRSAGQVRDLHEGSWSIRELGRNYEDTINALMNRGPTPALRRWRVRRGQSPQDVLCALLDELRNRCTWT